MLEKLPSPQRLPFMHTIHVNSNIYVSPLNEGDVEQLAERINFKPIADNTLSIPFPYHISDAEMFIASCVAQNQSTGPRNYAIRHQVDGLIGGIGQHYKYGKESHKDEIGYWLTPDHWGKGLMTEVVGTFVNEIVKQRNLVRIEAPVYQGNLGSARVLERNGFECEGVQRKCYLKNDRYINGLLYAKVLY